MYKRNISGSVTLSLVMGLILSFLYAACFADESLTITTYYPSPYGSYSQLTADQIAIGSTYRNPTYADGTLYVQGNVGIGTMVPARKLHVGPGGGNNLATPTQILVSGPISTAFTAFETSTSAEAYLGTQNGDPQVFMGAYSNHPLGISTNNTERIRVRADGNVMIYGNVGIGPTGNPTGGKLMVDLSGSNQYENAIGIENDYDYSFVTSTITGIKPINLKNMDGQLAFYTDGVRRVDINTSGKVGIGTATPQSPLTVTNTAVSAGSILSLESNWHTSGNYQMIQFGDYSQPVNYHKSAIIAQVNETNGTNHLNSMHFALNNTNDVNNVTIADARMTILSSGNVGIGTTGPGAKLHVQSAATGTGAVTLAVTDSGAGNLMYVLDTGFGYLKAAAWVYGSDRRMKKNISYLVDHNVDALSILGKLKPATFKYINGTDKETGFIAQDVQGVLPDLVMRDLNGMLGLKTTELIPYIVKGIQEQQRQIESLQKRGQSYSAPGTVPSDSRTKKDIRPYTNGLSIIKRINPVWFKYNGKAGLPLDNQNHIGVIGQEIIKVAPYTVNTFKAKLNPEDKESTELLNFNSHALTFDLINSVKELDANITKLSQENHELKSELENLKTRLSRLEAKVK